MDQFTQRLLNLAISIQQIPAPTFHEAQRAAYVRARFIKERLKGVEIDKTGNVYGCFSSERQLSDKLPPLIVTAHLDTVFPLNVDLEVKRSDESILAPGIGDNSLGVAGLFGLVWELRERCIALPGDLWLVANVCEEGLGNLHGMQAIVDRFDPNSGQNAGRIVMPRSNTSNSRAYIIVEGMALGQVYQRAIGVRRYRLSVRTAGGHSWNDYGRPSAVHELTALAARITALELPHQPRTTLNVGVISGGTSVNTIAAEAMLELDLRSENGATLENTAGQVNKMVKSAKKGGVEVEMEPIGQRPAGEIPAEHWLVRLAQECLREVDVEPHLNIGSTDANLPLSLGLPAITVGLTTGGRGHTVNEFINIVPLEKGVEQLVRLVSRAWD